MKRLTTEEYVERVNKIHPENDHSLVNYTGASCKITVICPIHGKFEIQAGNYLFGQGCRQCGIEKRRLKRMMGCEEFISRARKVHGDKYDYSKVEYVNAHTKVCVICPIHGEFWIKPVQHLRGGGCPKCVGKHKTTEDFIRESIEVHGNIYDYSKVEYKGAYTKICIICPKHGEFWITPHNHLNGRGCPHCKASRLEKHIRRFLKKSNINYEYQKRFFWLGLQSLDFYLPDYNIAIECQGRQHFESVDVFGGDKGLSDNKKRDITKLNKCCDKGIKILYIT